MTENETNRRPSGPPPSSFAPRQEEPVPDPTTQTVHGTKSPPRSGRMRKVWGVTAPLLAGGLIVAVMWPSITGAFDRFFGDAETAGLGDGNVYDFTQATSTDDPVGDVEYLVAQVPDGLVAAVRDTYTGSIPLRSVEVSSATYSGDGICAASLSFVWDEDEVPSDFDRTSVLRRDDTGDVYAEPKAYKAESFATFSEDWSTAEVSVECPTAGQIASAGESGYSSSNGKPSIGSSFVINFPYFVAGDTGAAEERLLAQAPIRIRDDGQLFVSRVRVNAKDEPNVPDWEYWITVQQWAPRRS